MYRNATRLAALREFVVADAGGGATVLYWITPKAAHTTIVNRLLRRPPFRILEVADAGQPERTRRARLAAALSRAPLEFTFAREPVGQLVSAIEQMRFCRRLPRAESVADYLATLYEFVDDRWPSERCRQLHLNPIVAGYPSPGFARLHFVGRVAHMRDDWSALRAALNQTRDEASIPVVNRNPRRTSWLRKSGARLGSFATHPAVAAHTEWDRRCLEAMRPALLRR